MAFVLSLFIGFPATWLFGLCARRWGAKPMIAIGLCVYIGICIGSYFMQTPTHFYILAACVGLVQGGVHSLSRSLYASIIPRQMSGEFFGLYSTMGKVAGIIGPATMAVATQVSGGARPAILFIGLLFVGGLLLLSLLDTKRARHQVDSITAPGPVTRS